MRYPIPARIHRTEQEIRRSRFITTISPAPDVEAAQAFIATIKQEFPDARHNCWAYLVGPPSTTDRAGATDDGEPQGTAGRPMLNMLLHSGLGDICAVITRYFGGTKLGTGGLVRAYSGGVKLALLDLPTTQKIPRTTVTIAVPYPHLDTIRRLLPNFEVTVTEESFAATVSLRLAVPQDRLDGFAEVLLNITSGDVSLDP